MSLWTSSVSPEVLLSLKIEEFCATRDHICVQVKSMTGTESIRKREVRSPHHHETRKVRSAGSYFGSRRSRKCLQDKEIKKPGSPREPGILHKPILAST